MSDRMIEVRQLSGASLSRALARVLLLTLLVKIPGLTLFPAFAVLLGIAMAPVVLPRLRQSKLTVWLAPLTLVAVVSGVICVLATSPQYGTAGDALTITTMIAWISFFPLGVAVALWAMQQVGLVPALRLVVLGGVINALLNELPHEWKGSLGIYVTVLVLLLAARAPLPVTRVVLVASALLSAVSDARFMSIIAILALACTFSTSRFAARVKARPIRYLILILGAFAVALWALLAAMKAGLLGRAIQLRTANQFDSGRPIIEAGRTEWAATLHLFSEHPFGFGIGEATNRGLVREAITHVQAVGGDYLGPYLPYTVFGSRVDFHSMLADLWYHFGVGGVALAAGIAVILLASLPQTVRSIREIGAGPLFFVLVGLWDLFFSPMGNSDRLVTALIVAAALLMSARHTDIWSAGGVRQPERRAGETPRAIRADDRKTSDHLLQAPVPKP